MARDTLQNFYDGQGQTLDDTTLKISSLGKNKAEIHIAASATYDADKLLSIGATGKNGADVKVDLKDINTGCFAEGAKQLTLCLLRDYGAEKVTFRSREWQIDFTLKHPGEKFTTDPNAKGIFAQVTLLDPPIEGNDITFTTNSKDLIEAFKNGKNLFYHSQNPDMQPPTYENETGGFKLIPGQQEAHFYHAGQRRGLVFQSGWRALDGIHIWTNKKILEELDRDRNGFPEYQIRECLEKIIKGMSAQEAGQALQMLMEDWFVQSESWLETVITQ